MIDVTTRIMWIKPVPKTTYNDNDYLRVETTGLAIKNAITKYINRQQFTIRYYTWPDTTPTPTLTRDSDDWCFMKQDSTRITSQDVTWGKYYSSYMPLHTYVEFPSRN